MTATSATTAADLPPPEPEPPMGPEAWRRAEEYARALGLQLAELRRLLDHAAKSAAGDDRIAVLRTKIDTVQASFRNAWERDHSDVKAATERAREIIKESRKEIGKIRRAHETREKKAELRNGGC